MRGGEQLCGQAKEEIAELLWTTDYVALLIGELEQYGDVSVSTYNGDATLLSHSRAPCYFYVRCARYLCSNWSRACGRVGAGSWPKIVRLSFGLLLSALHSHESARGR